MKSVIILVIKYSVFDWRVDFPHGNFLCPGSLCTLGSRWMSQGWVGMSRECMKGLKKAWQGWAWACKKMQGKVGLAEKNKKNVGISCQNHGQSEPSVSSLVNWNIHLSGANAGSLHLNLRNHSNHLLFRSKGDSALFYC